MEGMFRDILMTASAFSVGSALFAAVLCLRMVRSNPRRFLSFAAAKLGYAMVAGTVLLRIVLPNPVLPVDGWGLGYTAGLVIAGVGFVGVGRAIRRDFVEWEAQRIEEQREEDEASGNA